MIFNKLIIIIVICLIILINSGEAKNRIALVIGNSDYAIQPLNNPVNDAKDLAQTLMRLNFYVDVILNANQQEMDNAVKLFGSKLSEFSVGLFYYSGHGVQYQGNNYIIPIDIKFDITPELLKYKALNVCFILELMKNARKGLNIFILDACRNNPLKSYSRNIKKGLVRMSDIDIEGTIIAFSTSPGKIALDGSNRNSPYTKHLLNLIERPNIPIEIMLRKLSKAVKVETNGKQSPWYEASIDEEFYFFKTSYVNKVDSLTLQNNGKLVNAYKINKNNKTNINIGLIVSILCFILIIVIIFFYISRGSVEFRKINNTQKQDSTKILSNNGVIHLRTEPKRISVDKAIAMVKKYNFFHNNWNKPGHFNNIFIDNNDNTVTDQRTNLMWQKSLYFNGEHTYNKYKNYLDRDRLIELPFAYIKKLNENGFAGFTDWRLPTLEELLSLLQREKTSNDYYKGQYIDPILESNIKYSTSYTVDKRNFKLIWCVSFSKGETCWIDVKTSSWLDTKKRFLSVRAVRSL